MPHLRDPMDDSVTDHYTTITITEYNNLASTITFLRWQKQKAREFLEKKDIESALKLLRQEKEPS